MGFLKKISFLLVVGFAYLIASVPLRLRYFLSDFVGWMLHRVIKYRNKVVKTNLRNSFPEMNAQERAGIEKQFYHNLADIMLETIALLRMSENELQQSIRIINPEIFTELFQKHQSVFVTIGHTANWELLASYLSLSLPHQSTAIYKKLSDDNFDRFMKKLRQKHGKLALVESKAAYRYLAANKGMKHAVLILGDQTPQNRDTNYWTNFLHQDTPFFTGLEKMAKSLNFAVVYLDFYRIGRGKYEALAINICTDCDKQPAENITKQYTQLLERSIMQRPDNWLWSHKRWKHKRPA